MIEVGTNELYISGEAIVSRGRDEDTVYDLCIKLNSIEWVSFQRKSWMPGEDEILDELWIGLKSGTIVKTDMDEEEKQLLLESF